MERRETAANVILNVFYRGAFLQDALDHFVYGRTDGLSPAERAGAVFLSRGTAERKVLLETLLSRLVKNGVSGIKKPVRALLLTALFELGFADTAPYAAVNAWVDLSGKTGPGVVKGFVNAVLRRFLREKDGLLRGLSERERLSFSPFLYDAVHSWYGAERTREIGEWFLAEDSKAFSVRVNESKGTAEEFVKACNEAGILCRPTGVSRTTVFLSGFSSLSSVPGEKTGWFYPEAPAMATSVDEVRARILKAEESVRILDAAASPGGKALYFADLLAMRGKAGKNDGSLIIARDKSEAKAERLRENVRTYGAEAYVSAGVWDATEAKAGDREQFDLVNLDVPCSGIGVLSGKPEGKDRLTKEDLASLSVLQERILNAQSAAVRPGGLLLYSTCTLNPEENGENVRRFLMSHPEFSLLKERLFLPGDVPSDGFYYALMEKTGHRAGSEEESSGICR